MTITNYLHRIAIDKPKAAVAMADEVIIELNVKLLI